MVLKNVVQSHIRHVNMILPLHGEKIFIATLLRKQNAILKKWKAFLKL